MYKGTFRSPLVVVLLSFITCGIYFIVWLFMVSEEINNASGMKKVDPLIFFLLGLLCFPLMFIGYYKIDEALYELNTRMGLPANKNFILWLLLSFVGVGGLFMAYQVQEQLNKVWERS